MHHLIMRQVFQLTVGSEKDAYYLQHKVSNAYQREIQLILERVLDEICTDDQVIVIDRLEIDLGEVAMSSMRDDSWIIGLEEALREGLGRLVSEQHTEENAGASVMRRPGRSGVFEQWLFSMKRGYLPWNAGEVDDGWYLQVLEAVATDHVIAAELRQALAAEPVVVERIVQQHAATFLVPLTEALTAKGQQLLATVPEEMLIVVRALDKSVGIAKREIERVFWKKVLLLVAAPAVSTSASAALSTIGILRVLMPVFFTPAQRMWVVRQAPALEMRVPVLWPVLMAADLPVAERMELMIVRSLPTGGTESFAQEGRSGDELTARGEKPLASNFSMKDEGAADKEVLPGLPGLTEGGDVRAGALKSGDVVHDSEGEVKGKTGEEKRSSSEAEARPESALTDGAGASEAKSAGEVRPEEGRTEGKMMKKKKTAVEVIGGEEIFVHHAGVILLHPFLNTFFKILGLVAEGKFLSTECHTRALYLIHFLATGATDPREHDLLIAKILCAYPLEEPVDAMVVLSAGEIEEAGNLLSAAIASWSILKSTSAAGLREGFLQRSGKLQVKGDDLLLLVENSSIDMLLDHLPWNLGIIILPWMENILRTEWR